MRRIRAGLVAACLALAACESNLGPVEHVVIMDVAAQKATCLALAPTDCLRVREHSSTVWTDLRIPIEGFNYQVGCDYVIRVAWRESEGPSTDGSNREYRLLDIIWKQCSSNGTRIRLAS